MIVHATRVFMLAIGLAVLSGPALADKPQPLNARIVYLGKSSFEFSVTVGHVDTSWEHYANKWEIIGPNGKVLGTRVLRHPHIGQRFFTRVLRGVTVPEGVKSVIIRVHDDVHGYGREKLMLLPTAENRDTGWK